MLVLHSSDRIHFPVNLKLADSFKLHVSPSLFPSSTFLQHLHFPALLPSTAHELQLTEPICLHCTCTQCWSLAQFLPKVLTLLSCIKAHIFHVQHLESLLSSTAIGHGSLGMRKKEYQVLVKSCKHY